MSSKMRHGYRVGKGAGMRVIGIAATHSREKLLAAGADVVTDRLTNFGVRAATNGYRLEIQVD